MIFRDLCEWWTPERVAEEEAIWQRDRRFIAYGEQVNRILQEFTFSSVLDVGCGLGFLSETLTEGTSYTGVDGSAVMLARAAELYPRKRFILGNVRDFHKWTERFDLVCAFAFLKHFALVDYPEIIKKLTRLGKATLIQTQFRTDGYPSIEDKFPNQEAYHTWIAEDAFMKGLPNNVEMLEITKSEVDTSPYMDHSYEAYVVLRKREKQ